MNQSDYLEIGEGLVLVGDLDARDCTHFWALYREGLETIDSIGRYASRPQRVSYYYCQKCLVERVRVISSKSLLQRTQLELERLRSFIIGNSTRCCCSCICDKAHLENNYRCEKCTRGLHSESLVKEVG